MAQDLDKLQSSLHYQFSDKSLARLALTHSSASADNNERLEFLGDAILGYIAAEMLFERYPDSDEGKLSRLRARLVDRPALVAIARRLDLGEQMVLGKGESLSGGKQRESILANAVEALIAAVYLDGGLQACREIVAEWIHDGVTDIQEAPFQKDYKTRLQELLQARALALPVYRVVAVEGKPHQQQFIVECSVTPLVDPQRGEGPSKRVAEQDAARKTILALEASA